MSISNKRYTHEVNGAIGVGGGSPDEDHACALAGAAVIEPKKP